MKRRANYELLRIVAMLMILYLHIVSKGGILTSYASNQGNVWNMSLPEHFRNVVEAFCVGSVNAYILIGGYLGYSSTGKTVGKAVKLWGRVLFYSVAITGFAIVAGLVHASDLGGSDLISMMLPVSSGVYWFVTGYLLLLLVRPLLNAGIATVKQKDFRNLLLVLFVLLSVVNTFVPYHMPYNFGGNDPLWVIFVYLTGAYFGKYGFRRLRNIWLALACFVAMSLATWGMQVVLALIYNKTGKLEDFISVPYNLNSTLVYLGSVALLAVFVGIKINEEGKLAGLIRVVAETTFGIYLIHEHPMIRYEWQKWIGITGSDPTEFLALKIIGGVLVVFAACSAIEWIRIIVTKYMSRMISLKKQKGDNV